MADVHDPPNKTQLQNRRKQKNLQWKPTTNSTKQSSTGKGKVREKPKESTKDWVIRTFYSTPSNSPITNTHHSVQTADPPATTVANSFIEHPVLNTLERNCSQKTRSISSPASCTEPSTNPPIVETPERNLSSNSSQKRREHQKNSPNHIPKRSSCPPKYTDPSTNSPIPKTPGKNLSSNSPQKGRGLQQKVRTEPNDIDHLNRPRIPEAPERNLSGTSSVKRRNYQKNEATHTGNDPSAKQSRLSYAEVLKKNHTKSEDHSNAPNISPENSVCRGEPAVYFEDSVINASAEKFKYCLIGKFPRSWPSLANIRDWIRRQWKLRGDCIVTLLDHHHVFIRFDNIYDMLRIWVRNRWWISGHIMKVFRWTPSFQPAEGEPSSVAVWVSLPFLPVVLFQEGLLFRIANVIGKALAIDGPTRLLSRTNVARICVEVNLLNELPRRVWIRAGGRGFWQDIFYEKLPSYCSNCRQLGHFTRMCKFSATDAVNRDSDVKSATSSDKLVDQEVKADTDSQEQCHISKNSVSNSAVGEDSQAKDEQLSPSVQEPDGNNQPLQAASCELPSRRFSLVEALNERLARTQNVNSRKNKDEMPFRGTFSTFCVMNEVFRAMTEDGRDPRPSQKGRVVENSSIGFSETVKEKIVLDEKTNHAGNIILEEDEDVVKKGIESSQHDQQNKKEQQHKDFKQVVKRKSKRGGGKKKASVSPSTTQPSPVSPTPVAHVPAEVGEGTSLMVPGKVAVGAALLSVAPTTRFAWWRWRKRQKNLSDVADRNIHLGSVKRFSLKEIKAATDRFSNKNILGRGGFGKVYKGRLTDGSLVAVKRLKEERTAGGELQFQTEVEFVSMAVHQNLLRLRGFCITPTERLLVYPYMVNGSLASCLRERSPSEQALDWTTRKRIAVGSAKGLSYLHESCNPKIIHRDVKAANILLDENFEPHVGDFGLVKLIDFNYSEVSTCVRGTIGHIAPEYLATGKCSEKTDVFGYGIMLLELVTGQRTFDLARLANDDDVMLLDWVKGLLNEKKLHELVDPGLRSYMEAEAEHVVHIALLCTQGSPLNRPKMGEVVRMLEDMMENPCFSTASLQPVIETSPWAIPGSVGLASTTLSGSYSLSPR